MTNSNKKKEPVIKRKDYDFWVNGKKHRYSEYKSDKQELIICKCGNKTFWVYQPDGMWETDIICTKCYKSYVAHDG